MNIKCSFKDIFQNKTRIMTVFAHPDDTELYAGGTVARLIKEGKLVRSIKMSDGNKGSRHETISESDLKRTRQKENKEAMKLLGITDENDICLDLGDGEIDNSLNIIEKIVKQIRLFKPEIIITHNPEDLIITVEGDSYINHRDHRNTGKSVVDAVYPYSRNLLFFPAHFNDKDASAHELYEFLFVDSLDYPNVINIDVTEEFDSSLEALNKHCSQCDSTKAQGLRDFFAPKIDDRRYEKFRHVIID